MGSATKIGVMMDRFSSGQLISELWLLLGMYWAYSSRGTKKTVKRESRFGRGVHLLLAALCALLLYKSFLPGTFLNDRLVPEAFWLIYLAEAFTALGVGWAIWARIHLAGNWSAEVTLKENHRLILTGPYGLTRHPIYTGLIVAMAGTALADGTFRGLAAFLILFIALVRKSSIEEALLSGQFPEDYARYRAETKKLIPWIY